MGKRHYNSDKSLKRFGLKVRELRYSKGWTLEECEEHGTLNWRHLQSIEAGKNITVVTVINIANLFGVHPSVLFDDI